MSADLFGLSIPTGMISKPERRGAVVLEALCDELAVSLRSTDAANIDQTSWRRDRKKARLWVALTRIVTVLTIARHRSGEVGRALLGTEPQQVVSSDRFGACERIGARWRQIGWARLRP